MSYRFKRGDDSVEDGMRRIALEQIDRAIAELYSEELDLQRTIHQVRKRCKKQRSLIRLVRPVFHDYATENAAFRDAAQALSHLRDSEALIGTYDALVEAFKNQIERRAFAPVRRRLTLRQQEITRPRAIDEALSSFRDRMREARERVRHWRLQGDGFEAIAGGLNKTYKRAKRAMAQARHEPTAEAFHEWRKRSKYHLYHTRLLTPVWKRPMKAHETEAKRLSDLLGKHHDLAVFQRTLADEPDAFGHSTELEVLVALIGRRQAALEAEAFTLGARLLAETAPELVQRWGSYWHVWCDEQAARKATLAA